MSKLNLGDSLILDSDYSTSEVKTGATWINGKPIYKRTFQRTLTSAAWGEYLLTGVVSNFITYEGFIIGVNTTDRYPLNNFISSSDYSACWFTLGNTGDLRISIVTANANRLGTAVFTIYYTKITN